MSKGNKAPSSAPEAGLKCKFTECKKKPEKFGFCQEHYEWYMAGIIRGDGEKPSDYEEKLSLWKHKHKKKVA